MAAVTVARRDHINVAMPPKIWRRASPHLLADSREYQTRCVPLSNAARQGDWQAAHEIIMHGDNSIICAAIEKGNLYAVLHIAADNGDYDLVKQLLKLLTDNDLHIVDQNGNAAFCLAIANGNLDVVKIMLEKDILMAELKCSKGMSPLRLAAYHGHGKMALFLYPKIIKLGLEQREIVATFFICINSTDTDLYELASKMLLDYPKLAEDRDDTNGETAFQVLARKPSAFVAYWGKKKHLAFISALWNGSATQLKTPGLELLKQLCEIISKNNEMTVDVFLPLLRSDGKPSNGLFIAAARGNDKFLAELFASCRYLMNEKDECNRNVFHIAALHLQTSIFSLVPVGKSLLGHYYMHDILSSEDNKGNTILHSAAYGAAPAQYDKMKGTASRMNRHNKLFEEVRKIVPDRCIEKKNRKGKTAKEIFAEKTEAVNDLLVNQKENLLTTFAHSLGISGNSITILKFVWNNIFRF